MIWPMLMFAGYFAIMLKTASRFYVAVSRMMHVEGYQEEDGDRAITGILALFLAVFWPVTIPGGFLVKRLIRVNR